MKASGQPIAETHSTIMPSSALRGSLRNGWLTSKICDGANLLKNRGHVAPLSWTVHSIFLSCTPEACVVVNRSSEINKWILHQPEVKEVPTSIMCYCAECTNGWSPLFIRWIWFTTRESKQAPLINLLINSNFLQSYKHHA
jgi:hypothetical protein